MGFAVGSFQIALHGVKSEILDKWEFQISPPEPFTDKKQEDWDRWIRRFERYRVASGLAEKDDKMQVNRLLYLVGEKGENVLASFGLSEEDASKYDVVRQV